MKNDQPMNSLETQGYDGPSPTPKYHALPGKWARDQLDGTTNSTTREPKKTSRTELDRALSEEAARHSYWEKWQGVKPGVPTYEDPRSALDVVY